MSECSYCNEPLDELEQLFADKYVQEMPLCAQCIMVEFDKQVK